MMVYDWHFHVVSEKKSKKNKTGILKCVLKF